MVPLIRLAGGEWTGCDYPGGPRCGRIGLMFGRAAEGDLPAVAGCPGVLGPVGGCRHPGGDLRAGGLGAGMMSSDIRNSLGPDI